MRDMVAEGKSDMFATLVGLPAGYVEGLVEKLGVDKLTSLGKYPGKYIVKFAAGALSEGAQEFTQSISSSAFSDTYKSVDWDEATAEALYSGLLGVMLGGGASSLMNVSAKLQEKGVSKEDADSAIANGIDSMMNFVETGGQQQQEQDGQQPTDETGQVVDETGQVVDETGQVAEPPIQDQYGQVLNQTGLPQDVRVQPQPEQEVPPPTTATEIELTESGIDWETNYADKYGEIDDKVNQLTEQMKQLPKAQQPPIKLQIDELTGQQVQMEKEFTEKWKSKAGDIDRADDTIKQAEKPETKVEPESETQATETSDITEAAHNMLGHATSVKPKYVIPAEVKARFDAKYPARVVKEMTMGEITNELDSILKETGKELLPANWQEKRDAKQTKVEELSKKVNDLLKEKNLPAYQPTGTLDKLTEQYEAKLAELTRKKGSMKPIKKTEAKKPDDIDVEVVEMDADNKVTGKRIDRVSKDGTKKTIAKKRVKPLGKDSVKRALKPLDEQAQKQHGKDADKLSPNQINNLLNQTGTVIKANSSIAEKMGRWQNGYVADENRAEGALVYGGIPNGVFTDSYILLQDKAAVSEMDEIIKKKFIKDFNKTIQNAPFAEGESFDLAESTKQAELAYQKKQKDLKDKHPKLEAIKEIIGKQGKKAEVIGYSTAKMERTFANQGETQAFVSNGSQVAIVDANKLAFMEHFLPNHQIYMQDSDVAPIQWVKNGKIAGVLMPLKPGAYSIPTELQPKKTTTNSNALALNQDTGMGNVKFKADADGQLRIIEQPRDAQGKYANKNKLEINSEGEVDVASLSRLATNSFENSKESFKPGAIERAKAEIENGQARPVRIRYVDGKVTIEDGRHRVEAAKQLGIPTYPVEEVTSSYRSSHQIDTKMSRSLGAIQSIDDVVASVKAKFGLTNYDQKDIANLNKVIGNPEADVTIYRAAPVNELNSGDWVTTSKTYANDIKRQNGGKVYQYTVKAKNLNLPNNIEDNPSLARFSAFQYTETKGSNNSNALEISTKLEESQDPADIAMRESLAGKNRPTGATAIEGNQTMTEAERLKATKGDQGQAGVPMTPEQRKAFFAEQRAKIAERQSNMNAYQQAKKVSKRDALAKTPDQLKKLADDLNKAGQASAILRKGQLRSKKNAGEFQYKRGSEKNQEWIKLQDKVIENPKMYVTVLAHELSHAIEYNVLGDTKSTYDLFGELTKDERATIDKELRAIVDNLEGAEVAQAKPGYVYSPTEMLARYIETTILEPLSTTELAPTVTEKFEQAIVRHPAIADLMDAVNGKIDVGNSKVWSVYRDLRQTFSKHLGKYVGKRAYDAEILLRANLQRSATIIDNLVKEKFSGVKDSGEALMMAAEGILSTKDGNPIFGTHDIAYVEQTNSMQEEMKLLTKADYHYVGDALKKGEVVKKFVRQRYTAEQAQANFEALSPEGQQLIKDFTEDMAEAKDLFNRKAIQDVYKIDSTVEGWVHRGLQKDDGMKGRMVALKKTGSNKSLQYKSPGMKKQRGALNDNYVKDFRLQMTKTIMEGEAAKIYNKFAEKQLARISKPIARGQRPDVGWTEVTADLRQGMLLMGEGARTKHIIEKYDDITGETTTSKFSSPQQRYQVPSDLVEHYRRSREVYEEMSRTNKVLRNISKYWAMNILISGSSTGTNAISGGIQYAAKVMNDGYLDILTGDFTAQQTRANLAAPLRALTPKGWHEAPAWTYGGIESTFAGQFMTGRQGNYLDKAGDKLLYIYGEVENYWKKVITLSDLKGKNKQPSIKLTGDKATAHGIRELTKAEADLIALLNENIDIHAYDYHNVTGWIEGWSRGGGTLVKPFIKYPYKYSKQITHYVGGVFDTSLTPQERTARALTVGTMMTLSLILSGLKEPETPEGTPNTPAAFNPRGRMFIGRDGGTEKFIRLAKYPFLNVTTAGKAVVNKDFETGWDIVKDQIGSVAPIGTVAAAAFGFKSEYDQYRSMSEITGRSLQSYIPLTRIWQDVSKITDPVNRNPKGFIQSVASGLPIPGSESTKAKFKGDVKQYDVPIEPEVRALNDKYTESKERQMSRADALLSALTGIYINRIPVEDAKSYKSRYERNQADEKIRQLLREGQEAEAQTEALKYNLVIPKGTFEYYRRKRKK